MGLTYAYTPRLGPPGRARLTALPPRHTLALPKRAGSVRFAVIGDVGRGDARQYDTAAEMAAWHERFDFEFVLMLGDNIYPSGREDDFATRFERPYRALLERGVRFHAVIGNHDPQGIEHYAPFGMGGHRYYTFSTTAGPPWAERRVQFFALDTVGLTVSERQWLRRELEVSDADWRIVFQHHPIYTSGRYRFRAFAARRQLESLFVDFGVNVVFSGHEHVYERMLPQRGVHYFTSGSGGALRPDDLQPSRLTATGFDDDTHFMLVEVTGDTLHFQVINRTGDSVDAGRIERRTDGRRRTRDQDDPHPGNGEE
jgi:hypothetical protein